MNQAIIINDDYVFNEKEKIWQCTVIFAGEKVSIHITGKTLPKKLKQQIKFDWEYKIEEWFEKHEPNQNVIKIDVS